MNELSIIFNRMGVNTFEVLEAAGTKWNFLKFYPGLVGGRSSYPTFYKAKALGYHPEDRSTVHKRQHGTYIGKQTVKKIIAAKNPTFKGPYLGITFKENVTDIGTRR